VFPSIELKLGLFKPY